MKSKRLLVPLDGSSLAEAALPWAEGLAEAMDGEIVVFRAADAHALPGAGAAGKEVQALQAAQQYLNGVVGRITAKGLKAWPITVYGEPGDQIADVAKAHDVGMIVMSTHGRSGLGRLLFGSVADKVVRVAPVPVLLVRGWVSPVERWHRLLVPVDGSPLAEQALTLAEDLARALNMEVVLLRVVMSRLTTIAGEAITYTVEEVTNEREVAWEYLNRIADEMRRRGIAVVVAVEPGSSGESAASFVGRPGELIAAHAKGSEVNFVVMCSHCRSGLSRLLLGSVASDVLHMASVPVLLLNPGLSASGNGGAGREGTTEAPQPLA